MDYFLLQFLSEDLHLDKTNPAIGSVPTDRQDRRTKSGGDFYADQKGNPCGTWRDMGWPGRKLTRSDRKLDIFIYSEIEIDRI